MVMEAWPPDGPSSGILKRLGAAAKAGKIFPDIAVTLLDRDGRILAGEELVFGMGR